MRAAFSGDLAEGQRLECAGIGAGRMRRAVLPLDRVGRDLPDRRRALLAAASTHLLGRLDHRHAGGECDAAAAGDVVEADRARCRRRSGARARRDAAAPRPPSSPSRRATRRCRGCPSPRHRAVLVDVHRGARRSPPMLNQKPAATPRPWFGPSGASSADGSSPPRASAMKPMCVVASGRRAPWCPRCAAFFIAQLDRVHARACAPARRSRSRRRTMRSARRARDRRRPSAG